MIKKLAKIVFAVIGGLLGWGLALLLFTIVETTSLNSYIILSPSVRAVILSIFVASGVLLFHTWTPQFIRGGERAATALNDNLKSVSLAEFVAGAIGLILGLLIAYLVSRLFSALNTYLELVFSLLSYLLFGYLGISVATLKGSDTIKHILENGLKTKDDFDKRRGKNGYTPKILDTSSIIDGRIVEVLKTGFLDGPFYVPEFVLIELQHLADSSDRMKRAKGRRGLDIVSQMQDDGIVEVYGTRKDKDIEEIPEVDIKLVKLAQNVNGKVLTTDYNLNKLATIQGVEVLNINELANTLKPVVLPGESMQLFIVKEGKEPNQGVAFLEDGTMIVVEGAKPYIGKTIDVLVTSMLQTAAGRMIFGKPKE